MQTKPLNQFYFQFFIIALLCIFFIKAEHITGQEKSKNNPERKKIIKSSYHLKMYYGFIKAENSFSNQNTINDIISEKENSSNFGRLSLGFIIERNKSLHEIELAGINYFRIEHPETSVTYNPYASLTIRGETNTLFSLYIKYGYNHRLINIKDRFEFFLGISSGPYIEILTEKRKDTGHHLKKTSYLGNKLCATPRIIFNISNELYIDANVPVELANFGWLFRKKLDSDLSEFLDKQPYNDFFKGGLNFKLGIGIKL